jgi:hypothetical protein
MDSKVEELWIILGINYLVGAWCPCGMLSTQESMNTTTSYKEG